MAKPCQGPLRRGCPAPAVDGFGGDLFGEMPRLDDGDQHGAIDQQGGADQSQFGRDDFSTERCFDQNLRVNRGPT